MSAGKNISTSYLLQLFNTAIGFIVSIFITRLIGAAGRGDYSLFLNALSLASVWLGFSLPSSILYFVASKKYAVERLFSTAVLVSVFTSVLLFIVVQLTFKLGLSWMIFPASHSNLYWQLIFILQFFLTQLNSLTVSFLNGQKVFTLPFVISVISSVFTLTFLIVLNQGIIVFSTTAISAVLLLNAAVLLLQTVLNFSWLYKKGKLFTTRLLRFRELKNILGFAGLVYVCNSIQFLSYRMDLWFVDYYFGARETGIYSLAVSLAQLVWMLPNAIASVLYAYMSGSSSEGALEYLNRYTRGAFYASLLASLGGFLFFYFAIPSVYGKEFTPSILMIGILMLGIVPFSIPILAGSFFAGVHRVKYNFYASSIGFITCLFFDFLLIPVYGAIGACYATVLSYLASTSYCLYIIKSVFKGTVNLSLFKFLQHDVAGIVKLAKSRLPHSSKISKAS